MLDMTMLHRSQIMTGYHIPLGKGPINAGKAAEQRVTLWSMSVMRFVQLSPLSRAGVDNPSKS